MAAPVPSLVGSFANRLSYLLTGDGAGGTLTFANAGGATPDLTTDASAGPLKTIFTSGVNGIGTVAPGALTQGNARDLLLGDSTASVGNKNVPRALSYLDGANRSGATVWSAFDANVVGGAPTLTVTASAAAGTIYLHIVVLGAIGY